ncbi:MAG: class I SAM-dependent methyltransferase [Pseudomonadota bacterium]
MTSNPLNDESYWDREWRDIFEHYQNDRRFAYYLRSVLTPEDERILELGAGSFRDMQQLNAWDIDCCGTDFSQTAVELAQDTYPQLRDKILKANAFALPFADGEFDLSYHNGFWVCFNDADIHLLIKEQVRVSRRAIVAAVHNNHNEQFKAYFEKLKAESDLYSCRFFSLEQVHEFMGDYCRDVTVIPVGKGKKRYEDYLINLGLGDANALRACWVHHGMDLLEESERLLCIGTL